MLSLDNQHFGFFGKKGTRISEKNRKFAMEFLSVKMMEHTENPFVICKAAAGSGKTFTLVLEYLKMAMTVSDVAVRRSRSLWEQQLRSRFAGILAITFTNKAANEMKSRVMKSLREISARGASAEGSAMVSALLPKLNALPCYAPQPLSSSELQWMAQVVHSAILHRYTDFSISTIDSFMHRVVRTFAHDLDKPVDFEVMVEHAELIEHAVGGLMDQVHSDDSSGLSDLLAAYAKSRMEEGYSFSVERELKKLAEELFKEDTEPFIDHLERLVPQDYIDLHRWLTEHIRAFEQQVEALGQRGEQIVQASGLEASDCFQGNSGFYGYFSNVARPKKKCIYPSPNSYTRATFEEGRLAKKGVSDSVLERVRSTVEELRPIYNELCSLLGSGSDGEQSVAAPLRLYNTYCILRSNLFAMGVLGELRHQMGLYADESSIVAISDFNRLIGNIVEEQPAPFIYERLGSRYRHYLVDEFQDTSVRQWHNLVPLLENGVSQRQQSLVVGDGKQAIYRFRQGDVSQFVDLPRVQGMRLHGHTLPLEGNYQHLYLRHNRRTARAVVDFNNRFFSWLIEQEPLRSNALVQGIYGGAHDEEGHYELWQKVPDSQTATGRVSITFAEGKERVAVYEEMRRTVEMLTHERGYRLSDIMILTRSNRHLGEVSRYFQDPPDGEPIAVTSSQSFHLTQSHAVMAIIEALRWLADGADRVAAVALRHHLAALGLLRPKPLSEPLGSGVIDLRQMLLSEQAGIDFRPAFLLSLDLYDCCEELIRMLHLDGFDVPYVGALLQKVSDFARRHHDGIAAFLEWFDDNASADRTDTNHPQLSAASSDGIDAVRLLTIHKAKGLEAEVVICPFFPPTSHPSELWVDVPEDTLPAVGVAEDKQEGKLPVAYVSLPQDKSTCFDVARSDEQQMEDVDNLNLLYVALTRPREQLYIVCPRVGKSSKWSISNVPLLLNRYLDQCQPELGDAECTHHKAAEAAPKSAPQEVALRHLSYADWTSKVQVASPAEKVLDELAQERVRLGNNLHSVMECVVHSGDVEEAVERVARREGWTAEQRDQVATMAAAIVAHPDSARFFAEGVRVKCECDMVDDEGICRPDRVVFMPDETWVVDFKTGHDNPLYAAQMHRYCRALQQMNYPNVSGYLLFAHPSIEVKRVPAERG